ncbi:MAG: TonB-dependent receptor [Pseudomonadota bacterium]
MNWYFYTSLILAALTPALAATTLTPIVVTAKRHVPALSKNSVTEKDIQGNQYEHVTDAIANIPGVYIAQHGSQGQLTSVYIRGGNSEHTSVIIDGVKANDPSTGGFNFAGLGTESVSIVNVLRGVSVADGGSDALSGAIMIETRRGQNSIDGTPRFDTKIEGGSYDTYSVDSGLEGQSDHADYHVRVIRNASRGSVTTPNRLQTIPRQRQYDSSDRTGFVARTGVQLNDAWRINMWNRMQEVNDTSASIYHANAARHGLTKSNFHRAEIETDLDRYTQKMGYSVALTERINKSEYAPFGPSNTNKGRSDTLYFNNKFLVTQKYSVLTNLTHERQEQLAQTEFLPGAQHRAIQQTAAMGHKLSPTQVWNIELWGRWHHHTAFKHYYSTKAKTDYAITPTQTTLLASYGTGIRAPSLNQLYEPKGGNSSLNPEKSKGFDIGAEQVIIEKRARGGITYFEQDLDDLISNVSITKEQWIYMNISKAKTYGVESFVETKLGARDAPPITLRVEHTFLHAKNTLQKTQLLRRPMHKITAHVLWQVTEPLLLGAGLIHYGKRSDLDATVFNRVYRKGPTVLRLWGSYQVNQKTEFFGRVENAGNSHYEYPEGFAAPSMAVYAGVRVRGSF